MKLCAVVLAAVTALASSPLATAQECELPAIRKDWVDTAIALTTYAETGRAGDYSAVADNADGQGLSIGLLQWNFGQGTIAKIVNGVADAAAIAARTMPVYGGAFLSNAAKAGVVAQRPDAMKWVIDTQASDKATLFAEVRAFLQDPAVKASQDAAALKEANDAWQRARDWMEDVRSGCRPQFAQFAVFFDYLNHGGKGNSAEITDVVTAYGKARGSNVDSMTRQAYSEYIARSEATWVMGYPHYRPCAQPSIKRSADQGEKKAHGWDAQYNCAVWRGSVENGASYELWENELFFVAALGAKFRPGAREIFLNRKGTLAFGVGVINGSLCDFRRLYAHRESELQVIDSLDKIRADVESSCKPAQPTAPAPG